jgi:hypothetical protein
MICSVDGDARERAYGFSAPLETSVSSSGDV